MTSAPAAANRGACAFDVPPPAEKSAMSMPERSSVRSTSSTDDVRPCHGSVVPAERADAK